MLIFSVQDPGYEVFSLGKNTFVDIQKPFQTDKVSLQDRIVTPDDRERLHHDDGTAFGGALLELVVGIHESLVFCCTILPLASTRRVQSTYSSH